MFACFDAYGNVSMVQGSEREGFVEDRGQAKPRDVLVLPWTTCFNKLCPPAEVSFLAMRVLYTIARGCTWLCLTPVWVCGTVARLAVQAGARCWLASGEGLWMGRAGYLQSVH